MTKQNLNELEKELYDVRSQIYDLRLKIKSTFNLKFKTELEENLEILRKNRKRLREKIYYQKNCGKEFWKNYYKKNRERLKKYKKEYYKKNREKQIEYSTNYIKKNREKVNKYQREYCKKNRDKFVGKKLNLTINN